MSINTTNTNQQSAVAASNMDVSNSMHQRRIEFHLARKPFSSFPNNSSNFKLETLNPSSPSTSSHHSSQPRPSSSNSKKPDSSEFLDAAFDLDFGFPIPFRRIGAGLENLGNTCFLNSVIQCLTYTEPLAAYLQSGKHQNTCHVAGFCALCAIQKHVNRALQSTGRILAPKDLVSNLRCISRNFRNARQEDAHEYMIHLLESMHKCCLPSGVPAESPGAYEKSLVHKIFGGRLRSQVKCLQCSHCSNTFDPFLDLSLEIIKADSVYKALMHFTAAEQLDGGERQYKCERCKQKVRALKQLTVYKAPYVLTVHLKRFRHFAGQKIDKKVQFASSLNLKPFVSGSYEGDLTYTLYGVLVHAGWSTHSGHYYCFVRTSSGLWYSLDDNRVYQVSEKTVMEQKAYMLFYVRDRKNVGSKKAMDVHKENFITTMRNASNSCSIPGVKSFENGYTSNNSKEAVSSGLVLKNSEGRDTSDSLVQQNYSNSAACSKIALKKESNQKFNSTALSESSEVKENSSLPNTNLDVVVRSNIYTNGAHSDKSAKATASAAGCDKITEKNLASNEKPSISECPPSVDSQTISTAAGFEVRNSLSNNKNDGNSIIPLDSATLLTTKDGNGKTKDGVLDPTSHAISVVSKPRIKRMTLKGNSSVKSPERTPHQRFMTEMLKSRVGGTRLSTKMLYGASLSLRKRKRFKRVKQVSKMVLQKHLCTGDLIPADMGPSTSNSGSVGSFKHSHKKGHSSSVGGEKRASENSSNIQIVDVSDERNTPRQTVLASCKLTHETTALSLGENCKEANDLGLKGSNSVLENGVCSATTRGLEESLFGRWDGTESPVEKRELGGQATFSIGHVLDEWDEEYDRGKRKKVRGLRNNFGGPNVFQEIATKKAKLKT